MTSTIVLGTSLGAAMVFLMKRQIQKILTGFAAGVMAAPLSGACCNPLRTEARTWETFFCDADEK